MQGCCPAQSAARVGAARINAARLRRPRPPPIPLAQLPYTLTLSCARALFGTPGSGGAWAPSPRLGSPGRHSSKSGSMEQAREPTWGGATGDPDV